MQIKNSYTLNAEEMADLFEKLANSLRTSNSLKFEIKDNAAELEVATNFETQISFSDNNFALELSWEPQVEEESEVDWRSEFDKDMADAGIKVEEKEITPEIIAENVAPEPTSAPPQETQQVLVEKTLPDRIPLNTTTLSFDPGYWTSSFGLENQNSSWAEIEIDGDLENTKWSEDEDSLVAAPSIAPAKTVRRRTSTQEDDDDDLFSALDDLDKQPSRGKRSKQKPPKSNVSKPNEKKSTEVKILQSAIPRSKKILDDSEASNWKEPTVADNVTDDDWVKPSEFLKKNKAKNTRQAAGIPSPSTKTVSNENIEASTAKKSEEIITEVQDWKEPTGDSASDGVSIKPSEFNKEKKSGIPAPKGADDPRFKKPPTAPDKKKDKNDKGWAKW